MTGSNSRPERAAAAAVLLASALFAAEPAPTLREEWNASRGYPGGRVYGITQTTDGYLWIGTDRGLIRFDGIRFELFRHVGPRQTPIDSVLDLAGDGDGNLLVSAEQVQRLRLRHEELIELPRLPGQPDGPVSAIDQDRDGAALIATVRRGLFRYDGRAFHPLPGSRSDVTAAAASRDGTVWMGTATQGVLAFAAARPAPAGLSRYKVTALLPRGERGLWIGTDHGLIRWDGAAAPSEPRGPGPIQAMLADREGTLWAGTSAGLYRAEADGALTRYSADAATALYQDREGNLWAGNAAGIVRLRRPMAASYPLAGGGGGGVVVADGTGAVWCARLGGGLLRVAAGRAEPVPELAGVTALGAGSRGVWVGRKDGGVLGLGPGGGRRAAALLDSPVLAVAEDAGGAVWAGVQNTPVAEIGPGGAVRRHPDADGLPLDTVTAIEAAADGTVWLATAQGVAAWSGGRWRRFTAGEGLPPGRVHCLLPDGPEVVWVGSARGLAVIERGRARAPVWSSPLLQEPVFGMAADREGWLWLLTANEVLRLRRSELLGGAPEAVSVRRFGVEDGLPGALPGRTARSMAADARGRIWMALGQTLVMADPAELRELAAPAPVQLRQVTADEHELALGEPVTVPAGSRRTTLRFAGLHLAAPGRVRYRYRLRGFDPDWSEPTAVREATFTNLVPGSYTFEVQATAVEGRWDSPVTNLRLSVEPALWQTAWVRALAALAAALAVAAAYRMRLRTMQREWDLRFGERLEERTRIARELHDTLLQSFQGLVLRFQAARERLPADPEGAASALEAAIDRAAEAIAEGRDAVEALRGEDECDELGESLAKIDREFRQEARGAGRPEAETSYRVLVEGAPRRLHPVVRDDLYRIAREAVRNAFRHAGARAIELDVRYDDAVLRLRVRDDGAGISPKVLSSGQRKGHYGLPGMRERAVSIGGEFEIWSDLRRGTEIQITVPGVIAYARIEPQGTGGLH